MSSEFNQAWLAMLKSIGARNMPWGITGGNEWISYKQVEENDFFVQIFTHDSFNVYKNQKEAVVDFFLTYNSLLIDENAVKDIPFGYWKELHFMDKSKYEKQSEKQEISSIGNIYAPGAIINFGSMTASSISIDNSVREIEKQINEKGGEDKAELLALLEETKLIVEECIATKKIVEKPGFVERLTGHLSKHGWFYGAILQLLGTAFLL
ncbi:MAG: hypothetical protein PWQ08_685 [Clostridiales bacterium]|jgi:hypothetical protein|nr:hypothetical protein [Clostridiales bacterium]